MNIASHTPTPRRASPLVRLAGWSAYASGLIGAVSVFFFVLFIGAYVITGDPGRRRLGGSTTSPPC